MITPIAAPITVLPPLEKGVASAGSSEGFGQQLTKMLHDAHDQQIKADDAVKNFLAGDGQDIHQVMFAMEQARFSLMSVIEVRNKLVEAYQEVSRMPL